MKPSGAYLSGRQSLLFKMPSLSQICHAKASQRVIGYTAQTDLRPGLYNPSYSLVTLDNTLCFIHRGNKQHISYDVCQMASYYLHSALLLTKSSALHIGNSLPFDRHVELSS